MKLFYFPKSENRVTNIANQVFYKKLEVLVIILKLRNYISWKKILDVNWSIRFSLIWGKSIGFYCMKINYTLNANIDNFIPVIYFLVGISAYFLLGCIRSLEYWFSQQACQIRIMEYKQFPLLPHPPLYLVLILVNINKVIGININLQYGGIYLVAVLMLYFPLA